MRRLLLGLALATALAVPAAASAQVTPPQPGVICGTACDGGGSGWSGCTTVTGNDQGGVPGIAFWHHYLVVDYCKVNGLITSLSIVAHGCDTSGFAFCHVGPAWVSSGGVGSGWAYLEGHADYGTTINRLTGLSYTSVANVWIWMG
ncbi:MAG TPA: hypothetical protein VGP69_06510 [Gaiellaceae bacterium]|jgi:hypothetical protein|nr:hypothetical protein [Gaiellaceae bacterium]